MQSLWGSGTHMAIGCIEGEARGRWWSTWSQMDERKRWRKIRKDADGKPEVIDLVEEWFAYLDLR